MALTLLGKPSNTLLPNRDSIYEREPSSNRESSGSFRDSIVDKITGPQPVDVSICLHGNCAVGNFHGYLVKNEHIVNKKTIFYFGCLK